MFNHASLALKLNTQNANGSITDVQWFKFWLSLKVNDWLTRRREQHNQGWESGGKGTQKYGRRENVVQEAGDSDPPVTPHRKMNNITSTAYKSTGGGRTWYGKLETDPPWPPLTPPYLSVRGGGQANFPNSAIYRVYLSSSLERRRKRTLGTRLLGLLLPRVPNILKLVYIQESEQLRFLSCQPSERVIGPVLIISNCTFSSVAWWTFLCAPGAWGSCIA